MIDIIIKNLPILVVLTPLMMSLIVVLISNNFLSWLLTLFTTLITLIFSLLLYQEVYLHTAISYALGNWVPPLGIEYLIDKVSIIPIIIIALISFLATFFASKIMPAEINNSSISKVYSLWLLAIAGLIGLVTTGDAFNLFVFLEISSLASVALVAMGGQKDKQALVAAYNYLILGAIGATFYVIGVGLLYGITGTLNLADLSNRIAEISDNKALIAGFGFMVIGIMLKAAVFPLHIWLPRAYAYAPSAVSVLLAATATKASLYILARILFSVFDISDNLVTYTLQYIILPLSILAMFAGTIMAIYEKDIKRLLAHSSIAQIGYITLAFAIGTKASVAAGFIHLFNHALIKGALFMAITSMGFYINKRITINNLSGLGRAMPITFVCFVICSLSLAGIPLTAGFISKLYIIKASISADGIWIAFLILASSALSVVYLWKMIEALWFHESPKVPNIKEKPEIYIALLMITFLNIYFGLDASMVVNSSFEAANQLLGVQK
ncbi:monovalent cation/H+ antiporter subunit D family protein [Alphaproteobacteria bacterium]|jgi:multicomponent Na+:H+ antiporter subunit D|nr:monovalent cation/H+ antiporter subunit D family protein [Alphaproteobacteria bacterium]MDC6453497.1 monovalent cation/H+ antiporter subunit D family protein [Alphaproteobacteria bacterium]